MIAGNDHYGDIRQPCTKSLQLIEGVEDRGVSRPHRVEQVTCEKNNVRSRLDYAVDRMPERLRNIGFALVDTARCLAVILTEAKVQVGQVSEIHWIRALFDDVWLPRA